MNKKNIFIVLIFVLMLSNVHAFFFMVDEGNVIFPGVFDTNLTEEQYFSTQIYYDSIYDSLSSGNISLGAKFKLFAGGNILSDDFNPVDLLTFSIADTEEISRIQDKTGFNVYSQNEIDEVILNITLTDQAKFNEYLEYESTKNLYKGNINKMWKYIIAFFRILIELVTIGLYLLSLYMMVYVIIEAIPEALILMRDKMLEKAIIKKRSKK